LFRLQHALTQSIDLENRAALEARQQQLLGAGVLPATVVITNSLDMKFALIPSGEFLMGSHAQEVGRFRNELQRSVKITRPFLMSVAPVTQRQYAMVRDERPSYFSRQGGGARFMRTNTDRHPVESVLWDNAIEFCNAISAKEGLTPFYVHAYAPAGRTFLPKIEIAGGDGYRLPTEAEWEYACRAGATTAWCFGDDKERLGEFAHFGNRATRPVGVLRPNAFGLYDMHGNVWEWCWDRWGKYDPRNTVDPQGAKKGNARVIRGGSWLSASHVTRSASRDSSRNEGDNTIGFRICRTL
jgi:formylglycine-generating enzyme required for sulfatase activity